MRSGCRVGACRRGSCWVKSGCDRHVYDGNCDSGFTSSRPTSQCTVQTNTQCKGDDLRDAGRVNSADDCCSVCKSTQGCRAWTWNRGYDQHCWVKSGCSQQGYEPNCDSGVVNDPASVEDEARGATALAGEEALPERL
jgi:hypothetical protein